jgi:tRNA (cytidine/uridine-2'-O-)-methyltransferase
MKIILFQPQIPQNTGNIVRTCSVTNTDLILVRPLGFSIASRHLKRAGLDYWQEVNIEQIDDLFSFLEKTKHPFYFLSSKASKRYSDVTYSKDCLLIFGSESCGLPDSFKEKWEKQFITIPMKTNSRCLNLSNSVNVVLFEALRQQNFIF